MHTSFDIEMAVRMLNLKLMRGTCNSCLKMNIIAKTPPVSERYCKHVQLLFTMNLMLKYTP